MIKIELSQDELTALAGLLDAGIKSTGLSGVKAAASILEKLEAAVAEANAVPVDAAAQSNVKPDFKGVPLNG